MFILGAAVLYGWAAAIFVAVLTRVTLEIVERRPRIKLYYNGAVFALAAGAAGAGDDRRSTRNDHDDEPRASRCSPARAPSTRSTSC